MIIISKKYIDKALDALIGVLLFATLGVVAGLAISGRPAMAVQSCEWGLHFEQENTMPTPNMTDRQLNGYGAYFHGDLGKKELYITFDAGYENGYTPQILETLKKHGATAAFFVVGPYIEENPEIIQQMVEDGHIVGNHSYSHPDMRYKSREEFVRELEKTAAVFKEVTGRDMPKFYRPPQGKFSTDNLRWAQREGYTTVLWSSAYVDWNTDDQPSHAYAYEKIDQRTFDGAVFLLHSTSSTNAEILDKQLTKWEEMGYIFKSVADLPRANGFAG